MEKSTKYYFGKQENQKDPNAVNKHVAKPAKANVQQPKPSTRPIPKPIAPPDTSNMRTGDPLADSIFGRGLSIREYNSRTTFTPSLVASIEISRNCYQQVKTDDIQISKQLIPEYMDYYTTFCVWARIIHLKNKNQEPLTPEEEWLADVIRNREYSLLEPVATYIRSIGNVVAITGQHLYPAFPPLPNTLVQNKPGFFGVINVDNHNFYEEIPTFGVLAEAIQYAVSDRAPGNYTSVLNSTVATVNENLLGYKPLQSRKSEAKDLALAHGITTDRFPSSKSNTGINIGLINSISDILAGSKTFKITKTNFAEMSISGSQAQLVNLERVNTDLIPDVNSELLPYSLINNKESTFGLAVFCAFQLAKSSSDAATAPTTWLCVTPLPNTNTDYAPWINNRNNRRDLPINFKQKVFLTTSQPAKTFREDIITSLVITRR